MRPDPEPGVLLDTYESHLADAVVAVLRRSGVHAWTTGSGASGVAVHVAEGGRDLALATLAAHMDDVYRALDAQPRLVHPRGLAAPRHSMEDEDGPPIVMERIRRFGFLAVLLVPLLVVTLAAPGMPLSLALVVFVGGLVVVTTLRNRSERGDDEG